MTEDDPGDCVHDLFAHTMLGDTPLGRPVLGTVDTSTRSPATGSPASTRSTTTRPTWSSPPRATSTTTGRTRRSRAAFERAGALTRADAVAGRPARRRPALRTAGRRRAVDRTTEQAHLVLGMPGLARTDERRWALGVLNTALGGGMSLPALPGDPGEARPGLLRLLATPPASPTAASSASTRAAGRRRSHDVLKICRDELDQVVARRPHRRGDRAAPSASCRGSTVLGLEDTGALMNRIGKSELCWGEQMSVDDDARPDRGGHPGRRRARSPATCSDSAPRCRVIGPLKDKQAARLHEAVA